MPVFGDNLMEMMNNGGKYPMAIEDLSDGNPACRYGQKQNQDSNLVKLVHNFLDSFQLAVATA